MVGGGCLDGGKGGGGGELISLCTHVRVVLPGGGGRES